MGEKVKAEIYSGTSGLVLPVPNKQAYPKEFQDKSRLEYYASLFNSVEINSSFKKLPMRRTIQKWVDSVPEDFQFSFKISSVVTHNKGLAFNAEDIFRFMEVVETTGNKKGCLLVQFSGKLTVDYSSQLEKLLQTIRLADTRQEWKTAVEFRHASWYEAGIYELLHSLNISLVFHDMPPSAPITKKVTADFIYLRFHGTEKGYRGTYTGEFLEKVSVDIREWKAAGKTVYIYFNNTLGEAATNLVTLNRLLNA